MTKIVICGANGKMGHTVASCIDGRDDCTVIGGVDSYTAKYADFPIVATPAELPENKYYLFGKEGTKRLAEELNVPLLGQIPIVQSICESGDAGTPAALDENSMTGMAFMELARNVVTQTEKRNAEMAPTEIVHTH